MLEASELTPEMIDELDEFLMSDETPGDCMQLSDLDGFLTGIVVGPELIMPSEWMPTIWQGSDADLDGDVQEPVIKPVERGIRNGDGQRSSGEQNDSAGEFQL